MAAKNAVFMAGSTEASSGGRAEIDDSALAFAGELVGAVADIVGAQLTNDERTAERFFIRMRGNYRALTASAWTTRSLFRPVLSGHPAARLAGIIRRCPRRLILGP